MKNFKQTKLALAVGAALMVMAGGAYAAAGDAPAKRASAPIIVSNAAGTLETDAIALHTAAGIAVPLTLTLNFAPTVTAATVLGMAGFASAPVVNHATVANNDIYIHTLSGATKTAFPVAGIGNAGGWTNAGAITQLATIVLTPQGAGKFRISGGKLQYSADGTVAAFQDVNVDLQKTAGGAHFCSNETNNAAACDGVTIGTANSGDIAAGGILAGAVSLHSSVVPAVVMATRAKPASPSLVDGVTIATTYPLAAAPAAATIVATSIAGRGDVNQSATIADAGLTIQAAAANSTLNSATKAAGNSAANPLYEVFFTDGALIDWSSLTTPSAAAADAAAFNGAAFNTGVATATAGFFVTTEGTAIDYAASTVFKADGTVAKLSVGAGGRADGVVPMPATIVDGVSPALVSAETNAAAKTLTLTFSEKMVKGSTGAVGTLTNTTNGDLQEVAENVLIGTASMAALNLNNGGNLSAVVADGAGTSIGRGVLTITDTTDALATYTGTGNVTVNTGIGFWETNDAGYTSATPATLDGAGLKSASTVTEAASGMKAAGAAAITIAFADATASVATTTADVNKIGRITVKFPATKGIGYATGKTFANLTGQIVVTFTGLNAALKPDVFQFFPTGAADSATPAAGQMSLSAASTAGAANDLVINPPTDLVYAKLAGGLTGVNVRFLNADVNTASTSTNVLVGTVAGAPVVAAGNLGATLPLSATATVNTLLTQSVQGTLTGASNGSLVHAYLTKWVDKPATTIGVTLTSGKVTSTGDKVATDLMLEYADGTGNALKTLIAAQLNAPAAAVTAVNGVSVAAAAVTAKPIPVYIKLIRSSDTQANTKAAQNYLEARAILGTTITSVRGDGAANTVATAHSADQDPVYECMLDPKTGKITGRLTGEIGIKPATTVTGVRGLVQPNGAAGALEVAQGLVDATGKFNLLVGVEPTTADLAAGSKGNPWFLILVHEDQSNTRKFTQLTSASPGAANFVAFDPNLLNQKGTRTILGTAPGIAAPFTATTGSAANISLANYHVASLANSTNWALVAARNPALASGTAATGSSNFERTFVGIDSTVGAPASYWTNDTATADMAMALAGNKVSLATELEADGSSLNTFSPTSYVPNAVAIAWSNDVAAANKTLTFAQAAAPTVAAKVPTGWSLVPVPTAGLTAATVDAVINVGAGATQFTWIKATDGTMPTLTAGQPVFVFSKAGGNL